MSWGLVKKINSDMSQPLDKIIGAANDTGATNIVGTVRGKLNEILNRLTLARAGYLDRLNAGMLLANSPVKSIQRGHLLMSGLAVGGRTVDLTISPVVMAKSMVLINVGWKSGTGSHEFFVHLTSTTNLNFMLWSSGTTNSNFNVAWQVVEFY